MHHTFEVEGYSCAKNFDDLPVWIRRKFSETQGAPSLPYISTKLVVGLDDSENSQKKSIALLDVRIQLWNSSQRRFGGMCNFTVSDKCQSEAYTIAASRCHNDLRKVHTIGEYGQVSIDLYLHYCTPVFLSTLLNLEVYNHL